MADFISVYVMGKEYQVVEGMTILKALEYVGYRMIRGCGCRGGFCGACGTLYRLAGDYRIYAGLACQTQVEDGMTLTQIPFFPATPVDFRLEEVEDPVSYLEERFPRLKSCLGCNSCTRICPQELDVRRYIHLARQGKLAQAAALSFDCIQCGLCASRCPGEIVPHQVGTAVRRLYSRFLLEKLDYVERRCQEVESGVFQEEIGDLLTAGMEEIKARYAERDMEQI